MIRLACSADLPAIAAIYDEILDHEAATISYTNWKRGCYPTPDTAQQALDAGTLYVGTNRDGGLFGCMILNHIQPAEYAQVHWSIPGAGEEILVIHTLCVPPSQSGHGHGRELIAFGEEYARAKGCKAIRFDTYEGNLPALTLYPRLGYSRVGETDFFFEGFIKEVLVCFEKAM